MHNLSWIQTYSGRRVDLYDPQPESIDIVDIAHALSNICRFTGHTKEFYSVAQHCVLVASNVPEGLEIEALLHDAAEAYVSDLNTPLKHMLRATQCPSEYDRVEELVYDAIVRRFFLPYEKSKEVKHHDLIALMTERRDLMFNPHDLKWDASFDAYEKLAYKKTVVPLAPREAKRAFLDMFYKYYKE